MADFMCDPLFPQITFRVRTLYPEQYVSRSHPDNNVENIYLNLRNQTVWIDNVPYALKNGDTFTLYGEEALEVLRQYRQINLQEWVLDILYYGPVVCDLPTPTPIPSVTPTPLPTNTPTPTPVPNCLPLINTVSVENIDGFKIVFNGSFGYYGVGKGTYLFSNVPASHPIAFLNKNQESKVAFSGQYAQIPPTVAPDGNTYTYFYGDVILDVFDDFGVLSYADYFFGYLGGRFNLGFYSNCAVATPTPTLTLSPTPSPSPTPSMSLTPSPTVSLSPTPYPTISPTETPVPTHSQTPIPTLSPTFTPVPTNSMTPVPTNSPTPEPTVSPTETPIPTNSPTPEPTIAPTETPIPTASLTPEPTISPTETPTPTNSPTPEPTISPTETPIASPTETPTPTASETPIPTESVTPTPSPSPTPTVTQSPTPSPSESPTPTPTGSPSPTPTVTQSPTPSPSESPTPTPTGSPSPTPSMSPSPTPSPSESPTPTPSPSPSRSPTPSPSPSPSSTPAPTPAPADPTLQIWYNGSDTTKYQPSGANGTAITQWNDSSNLAHNAGPSGGPGARPTVTYNSQNGLPALLLDGGDNLGVSNMGGLANIQNASIIVVAKTTQPANTQILTTAGTNSSTIDDYQILASSNVYVLKMAGGTGTSSVATDGNVHVHTMLFDGTQATNASRLVYRVDGVQQTLNFGATTIGTNTNASITYMYFGADQTPARNLTGTLCEILIYTQTLSGSSLANTEKYLKDKWAIV